MPWSALQFLKTCFLSNPSYICWSDNMKVALICFFVNLVMWELHDSCLGEQWASYVAYLMDEAHTACLHRFMSCGRLLCQGVQAWRGAPSSGATSKGWSLFDLDKILFCHFDTSKQIPKKKACYHLARSLKKMVFCFLNGEGRSLWWD